MQKVSYFIPSGRLGGAGVQLDHPALNFGNPRRVGSFIGSRIKALYQEAGQHNTTVGGDAIQELATAMGRTW
jgi:hypothetical protein